MSLMLTNTKFLWNHNGSSFLSTRSFIFCPKRIVFLNLIWMETNTILKSIDKEKYKEETCLIVQCYTWLDIHFNGSTSMDTVSFIECYKKNDFEHI